MAEMEMETPEEARPCSSGGGKRFKLRTTLQASFGAPNNPDYVFDIAASEDNSVMVVSLSTNALKLYSPITGQFLGDCLGHTDTINEVLFPDLKVPQLFCTSSSDGTVRLWDMRMRQQVTLLQAQQSSELFSVSFGGSSGSLIASGGKAKVLFWDWRTRKELACLEECHTEDVTQVRFHPTRKEKLVSASVDGLMCVFNTLGEINDDEGLDMVMGVGTSVGRIGFFGKSQEVVWCLTHIETLSIWDFEEGSKVADFNDTRTKASANWALPSVDYLVDCHYSHGAERLWLIAGNNSGSLGYFPLSYSDNQANASNNTGMIGPVSAVLDGGHTSVVRSVWSPSHCKDNLTGYGGMFCWTGGEDGRLCSWSEGDSDDERSNAWASKALVMKTSSRKKLRKSPY
ncbi:hypothetical protein GOP47_0010637 [Adiantum capillus-veneris]|uniref:WD repeat-containing protein 89 homolog n=1 Tax=Adiantum capillus-veneris TaxID=13818 RepID=A0A9D4UVD9_ADICA|nr:hypothetical protein GOP47_0010637 [Adiantum capillus-veneris]